MCVNTISHNFNEFISRASGAFSEQCNGGVKFETALKIFGRFAVLADAHIARSYALNGSIFVVHELRTNAKLELKLKINIEKCAFRDNFPSDVTMWGQI